MYILEEAVLNRKKWMRPSALRARRRLLSAVLCVWIGAALLSTGCSNTDKTGASTQSGPDQGDIKGPQTLMVADQFGLAYAPIEIMKQKGYLEAALSRAGLSSTEVVWKRMGNTAAMREAMLSGDLDIGFVGIPPFLIGADNGMDWRILSGISRSEVALISKDPEVHTLADIGPSHTLLLPQPGSIQHILLQMGLAKGGMDPKALDGQLSAMSHPDGVMAFQSGGAERLHFTTPPFIAADLEVPESHVVIDGEACFGGPFTFIVGMCPKRVYELPGVYAAYTEALDDALAFMEAHPDETVALLAEVYAYTEAEIAAQLSPEVLAFGAEVEGLETFIGFMADIGMLSEALDAQALYWKSLE